jgi:hypothetical protein
MRVIIAVKIVNIVCALTLNVAHQKMHVYHQVYHAGFFSRKFPKGGASQFSPSTIYAVSDARPLDGSHYPSIINTVAQWPLSLLL